MLETALNNLFQAYGVLIRKSFHLVGEAGEGIVEQIDGIIELSGVLYFVEMKWYRNPVGNTSFQSILFASCRVPRFGIFISASDYTEPAILTAREFLQHKVVVLSTLLRSSVCSIRRPFRVLHKESPGCADTETRISARTIAKHKVRYDCELDGHQ